jgi:hypothetical protein
MPGANEEHSERAQSQPRLKLGISQILINQKHYDFSELTWSLLHGGMEGETDLLTYLLTYLFTYLLTYLLTYSLTHSLTHPPTYLPTYQLIGSV